MDEVKRALKDHSGDTAMLFLSECLVAFADRDYAEAMRQVNAGLVENPDHPKLLLWRGMVFFKEYKFKEAVEAFRRVLEVDPNCEDAKNMLSCRDLAIYSAAADRLRDV
jgi:tetratricopeptide (TPR) repeat protein